jgi:C4-dicarboxylate-specific signal transduction histidine kinase
VLVRWSLPWRAIGESRAPGGGGTQGPSLPRPHYPLVPKKVAALERRRLSKTRTRVVLYLLTQLERVMSEPKKAMPWWGYLVPIGIILALVITFNAWSLAFGDKRTPQQRAADEQRKVQELHEWEVNQRKQEIEERNRQQAHDIQIEIEARERIRNGR